MVFWTINFGENEKFEKYKTNLPDGSENNFANIKLYGGVFTGENSYGESQKINGGIYLRKPNEKVQGEVVFTMLGGVIKANTNIYAGEDGGNTDSTKAITKMIITVHIIIYLLYSKSISNSDVIEPLGILNT